MAAGRIKWIRYGFLLLCCVALAVSSMLVLSQKEELFEDEYSSYGCANGLNGKAFPFENGKTYTPEELRQLTLDVFAVSEGEGFHLGHIWSNLSHNVHPPVFYVLLHIACYLTPGVFSVWQAGLVNLLFGLVSLVFFQKFVRSFISREWLAGLVCLCWACSQGLCANVVLLRDYAAAMCFTLIAAWECFRYLRGSRRFTDLLKIAAASALAILSHYYAAIYLFFLCVVIGVLLMSRKNWRDLFLLYIAEGAAVLAAVAVFPAMVNRILNSSRGVQATENLASTDLGDYGDRLSVYSTGIDASFFGGLFLALLALAAVLLLLWVLKRKKGTLPAPSREERGMSPAELCVLLVPAVCYFFLVSKISAYKNLRYMYPAAPVMYLSVVAGLVLLGTRLLKPRALAAGLAAVLVAVCCCTWSAGHFRYLYRGLKERQEAALSPYQGVPAVQIWNNREMINMGLSQYHFYSSVSLYYNYKIPDDEADLRQIPVLAEGQDVMVLLGKNIRDDGYVEKLLEFYPGYTVTELGTLDGQSKFYNYYFHRESPAEEAS